MNNEQPENRHPGNVEKEVLTLPASILIAAVLLSGSIFYYAWSGKGPAAPAAQPNDAAQPSIDPIAEVGGRDVILGDPNAKVTLIEYGDFQCPFCGRFYQESERQIKDSYVKTNKVRMVYRDIAFLGPESQAAGNAAECAKDQGKFWAYHDALYEIEIADGAENNGNLTRALFIDIATDLGMNVSEFTKCVDENRYANQLLEYRNDLSGALGGKLGTPAVFINREEVPGGARPYPEFKAVIDAALAQ